MNTKATIAGFVASFSLSALFIGQPIAAEGGLLTAHDYAFMDYITRNSKSYETVAEFRMRSEIFKEKLAEIEAHNADST